MTETKNSTRKNFWILGIVVALISIFVFVQAQMNSAISNHPKVVAMEIIQEQTCKELKEIKTELKDMNRMLNKLLMEEYP